MKEPKVQRAHRRLEARAEKRPVRLLPDGRIILIEPLFSSETNPPVELSVPIVRIISLFRLVFPSSTEDSASKAQ